MEGIFLRHNVVKGLMMGSYTELTRIYVYVCHYVLIHDGYSGTFSLSPGMNVHVLLHSIMLHRFIYVLTGIYFCSFFRNLQWTWLISRTKCSTLTAG